MTSLLPSPPTDSLYKFAAIFGLVLILFSLSYPVQQILKARQLEIDGRKKLGLLYVELIRERQRTLDPVIDDWSDSIQFNINTIRKAQAVASGKAITLEKADVDNLNSVLDKTKKFQSEFNNFIQNIEANQIEKNAFEQTIKPQRFLFWCWIGISFVCFLVGTVIGWRGFRLWYERIQRQQDRLLRHSPTKETEHEG